MQTRKKRTKRIKLDEEYLADLDEISNSSNHLDPDDVRKSRIRDSNKEFARRMTILQSWSEHWTEYSLREGEAYPRQKAKDIIAKAKKITCPIESCGKSFTTPGGLRYHYARCNIERSFRCIVCNPPLSLSTRGEILRHMIQNHYTDLPELNDEQKEIANSYLSCEHRGDKGRKDKKSSENEVALNAQSLVKAYFELRGKIFCSEQFADRPYKEWQSSTKDWELVIYEMDRRRYYPPEVESVRFKLSSENDWKTIKTGESSILHRDKKNAISSTLFYTGGINTASSWLPKPPYDKQSATTPDLIAVSVNCCSMDKSYSFKDSHDGEGCIQFWTIGETNIVGNPGNIQVEPSDTMKPTLSYIIGHSYGTIFDMMWCPLGASWQPQVNTGDLLSRIGLLAIACGDGQLRILSVPHTSSLLAKANCRLAGSTIESKPVFRVKPTACLMAPGVGPSTNYQAPACKAIRWNLEDNQRLIIAGYSNGNVALFDLANNSPILYTTKENYHIYQPLKCWMAHGAPVTAVSILSDSIDKTVIATGSTDRQLKIWNPMDLNSCLISDRAPITKTLWDYRYRGVVIATDSAFTSFSNKVTYRYPVVEGSHSITVSTHRSTVWGLDNSTITNSIASSDGAGEVFILPHLVYRSTHKRDKNVLSTHSLYTMVPQAISQDCEAGSAPPSSLIEENNSRALSNHKPSLSNSTTAASVKLNDSPVRSDKGRFSQNNAESVASPDLETKAEQESRVDDNNPEQDEDSDAENCFSAERDVANKPTKFLIPIEHRPVEAYLDFKNNFGIEFIEYNSTTPPDAKLPESCIRASETKNIYCDRPCDYPFSSINCLSWSPNIATFSHLLSASQIGLCRLDKVHLVEQVYRGYVDSMKST